MMSAQQNLSAKVATMNDQSASPFFSKLPPELRGLIYKECLFVGEVVPYTRSTANTLRLQLPLLRTCKALNREAEPIFYKNTLVLRKERAIHKLFQTTFRTLGRALLPRSVEIRLSNNDFTFKDSRMASNHGIVQVCGEWASSSSINLSRIQIHRLEKIELRNVAWQRKVDLILDSLTLDRLVLDLTDSFCDGTGCECRMAAMAILCFKKGFAMQAPKAVEIKGWDTGRPDVDAVVRDCLRIWTERRVNRVAGDADAVPHTISDAEKWLLGAARAEEED